MKPNKEKVGRRIKEIRTKLGYSMEEFGKLINNSPRSSVNNWEKGVSIPKKEKLEKIALLGKMLPEQVLYGRAEEYLFDLLKENYDVTFSDEILYDMYHSVPPNQRSYDDLLWLGVGKYFIENGFRGKVVGHLVYEKMLGMNHLYAGQFKNEFIQQNEEHNKLVTKYYAFSDTEKNILHVVPFLLIEENKKLLYEFPDFLLEENNHSYYTEEFSTIGLKVENSTIIYYGLNASEQTVFIKKYVFQEGSINYEYRDVSSDEVFIPFLEELEKFLKKDG